ncbi:MAG: glycosyl transferase, partial [Acetobacteraceae bacterium]|nr:glycosyl transferase [Acetobacteraceae bacterium]
ETVQNGVTGWRVRPSDPAALAAMIEHVLALDAAERLAVGARARASVPTVRAMQDATLDVYRAVLAS